MSDLINEVVVNDLRLKTFFNTVTKKRMIRILLPVVKFCYHRYVVDLNVFVEFALQNFQYNIKSSSPIEIQVMFEDETKFYEAYLALYRLREFLKKVKT